MPSLGAQIQADDQMTPV